MTPPRRFDFTLTLVQQRRAMVAAGQALMTRSDQVVQGVIGGIMVLLAGLGVACAVLLLTAPDPFRVAVVVFLAVLSGGVLFIAASQVGYRVLARRVHDQPCQRGLQTQMFDADGVTSHFGDAKWVTPWDMVTAVRKTRGLITVSVGGIAFPLPTSAVGDPAEVDALIQGLKARIGDA